MFYFRMIVLMKRVIAGIEIQTNGINNPAYTIDSG